MFTVMLIVVLVVLVLAAVLVAGSIVKSASDGNLVPMWMGQGALEAIGQVIAAVMAALLDS